MKFTTVATALLCAEAALAFPTREERREARIARRRAQRAGQLNQPVLNEDGTQMYDNETQVSYSTNWAGAVLVGSGYHQVVGTITVPTPSGDGAASAWVGIDGDTCQSAILQTGVDFTSQNGQVSFDAWYEWFPDYAYDFSGIPISAGDQIKMTVSATSTSSGSATIENLSTGKQVSHTFSSPSGSLCGTNAEWIVEDFESGNSLVPFADFGTVKFTGAQAVSKSLGTVGTSGAQILDIKQSKVLTSCSASGTTVTCSYI